MLATNLKETYSLVLLCFHLCLQMDWVTTAKNQHWVTYTGTDQPSSSLHSSQFKMLCRGLACAEHNLTEGTGAVCAQQQSQ